MLDGCFLLFFCCFFLGRCFGCLLFVFFFLGDVLDVYFFLGGVGGEFMRISFQQHLKFVGSSSNMAMVSTLVKKNPIIFATPGRIMTP